MNVVVTGGTGFIGRRVVARLLAASHAVTVVTRDAAGVGASLPPGARTVAWGAGAADAVRAADGIVNLAGEPIAQRWTSTVRARLLSSRVDSLDRLRAALEGSAGKGRPKVLVSASAVGIYGDRGDQEVDESSPPADDFLGRICTRWEEAARAFEPLGIRVAIVRVGVVLGADGGALRKMLPAFRLGGGGPVGSGRQWMSWITVDDAAALFVYALETPSVAGVLNGTAPSPVTNAEFARALGRALSRPAILPVPSVALKLLFGEMAQIVLGGQKVLPRRTLESGFVFRDASLDGALRALFAS